MSLITECSRTFMEKVVELKLSPPICLGRLEYDPQFDEVNDCPSAGYTRWFIGFCTEDEMNWHLWALQNCSLM